MLTYETHPVVMWELTRACDLGCRNCATGASASRASNELTTYECYKTVDQIASLSPRELILTGGDPLERDDVLEIIDYARRRGLDPALVVSPTWRLTHEAILRLKRSGLSRMVFGIDGSVPGIHHTSRGLMGTFTATLLAASLARDAGLTIEINTLITRTNVGDLPAIADLLRPLGIVRWNLYFLVPRVSSRAQTISADDTERLFGIIDEIRARETFAVRVMEAPHYRRYRLQRALKTRLQNAANANWSDFSGYETDGSGTMPGVLDSALDGARGFVFISHDGDVRTSEFLPFSAGNLRYRLLSAIYRSSDLFVALRDTDYLTGKCGRCEFRHICGGSRPRAWSAEGILFSDDPLCSYQPSRSFASSGRAFSSNRGMTMSERCHAGSITPWQARSNDTRNGQSKAS